MLELGRLSAERERGRTGSRWIVAELGVLHDHVHGVEPEAVDAAEEPEADDVLHRGDQRRVAPVQVGLLGIEGVEVPAPAHLVAAPRRAAEDGGPVVRRPVDRRPDVPVRMLAEPRVLDRGM